MKSCSQCGLKFKNGSGSFKPLCPSCRDIEINIFKKHQTSRNDNIYVTTGGEWWSKQ